MKEKTSRRFLNRNKLKIFMRRTQGTGKSMLKRAAQARKVTAKNSK